MDLIQFKSTLCPCENEPIGNRPEFKRSNLKVLLDFKIMSNKSAEVQSHIK